MASTINNTQFENDSNDGSFTLEDAKQEQESLDSVDLDENQEIQEKSSNFQETDDIIDTTEPTEPIAPTDNLTETMENLELEQIPLGTDKLLINRRNMKKEGEILVFKNEDTEKLEDLEETNIEELDSDNLDGDELADPDFDEKLAMAEMREEIEKDEECEDSSRESVEKVQVSGMDIRENESGSKLVFEDVERYRAEQKSNGDECEGQGGMGTECLVTENMDEYDDAKDADFNPIYCDQTLSDVELVDEDDEEATENISELPEVLQLKDNTCMFRIENMKIPPMQADFEEDTNEMED